MSYVTAKIPVPKLEKIQMETNSISSIDYGKKYVVVYTSWDGIRYGQAIFEYRVLADQYCMYCRQNRLVGVGKFNVYEIEENI